MSSTVFDVLVDPHRRRIVQLLRERERSVGELVLELQLSQPAVSKHLRSLRDGGLAEVRVDGRHRYYQLRPGPLEELDAWLRPFRSLWTTDP